MCMDDNADAKRILLASPLADWRRQPGHPRITWLIGAMVCLLAAPWVQLSISAGNGWPYTVMHCSCQSAATSEIVNCCWSRVHSCKWRYSKCPDLYLLPLPQHRPTRSETTPPYTLQSSRFGSEPPSVEDDVDVWRNAVLELHTRNDNDDP